MIHSVRIGPKARGRENDLTSVCVVVCYSATRLKQLKRIQELSIPSCVTFITKFSQYLVCWVIVFLNKCTFFLFKTPLSR